MNHFIERPFPSDPTDPALIRALAEACGFCQGRPVGDAASWLDGRPRPPAPCPRCGVTSVEQR